MRKNIIITGMPKSGKSTILKNVITKFGNKTGFVTNEIRNKGERVGFEIETQASEKSILAHVDFETDIKVSKYSVDLVNLDLMIPKVSRFDNENLLFLDEIGQMELYSDDFKKLALSYLDASNICIATLSKIYSDDFTESIKNRSDIILVEISEENRVEKQNFIEELIGKITKAKKYLKEPDRFTVNGNGISMRTDHGIRNLNKENTTWKCDCGFFNLHDICSHVIAVEESQKI